MVWLLMLGLVRQVLWAGWALIKRRPHQQPAPVPGIGKSAGITAGAYLVIAVFLIAVIAGICGSVEGDVTLALRLMVILIVIGWFWVRWWFKSMCQETGVSIPGRFQEAVYNWVPAVAFCTMFMAQLYHDMSQCSSGFQWLPPYDWIILAVVLAVVTWFKLRTPDYYASANLSVQHYLACLALWASLVVMPLLLLSEVVVLHNDHTGIGANKSVELLNERASASDKQMFLQIQDIVRKVE
ncbi:MAG: hypothetical protein ACYC1M_18780 [Armatimonadota bacterium]